MNEITVVGGGLGGLISAIGLAEAGRRVSLHEAAAHLGGRARTDRGAHRVNVGPHALYRHGGFSAWLEERGLLPGTGYPSLTGLRFRTEGRLRRMPLEIIKMMRSHRLQAPIDLDYRSWATPILGAKGTEAAIGFASLPTFHADPGTLSAAFVQERIHRSCLWRPVYYIRGGWGTLVDMLLQRATRLGVTIKTRSKLHELPDGPVVVAVDLPAAAKLLRQDGLAWPSSRTVLFDVALEPRRGEAIAILDLDERVYVSRYSHGDPSVAPRGEFLIQAVAGVRQGEADDDARKRIEEVLDAGLTNWRQRTTWKRSGLMEAGVGALDPPGKSWRDRPAIDRGAGRWLVGDRVAAPGVLSEVAFESAMIATRSILEKESQELRARIG